MHIVSYQQLENLYAEMASAAQEEHWERLLAAEAATRPLIERLSRMPDAATLGPAAQRAVAGAIRRIQAHDAVVRAHVGPWLEEARKQLGGAARARQIGAHYGGAAAPHNHAFLG